MNVIYSSSKAIVQTHTVALPGPPKTFRLRRDCTTVTEAQITQEDWLQLQDQRQKMLSH